MNLSPQILLDIASASSIDLLALALSESPDKIEHVEPEARELIRRYGMNRLTELSRDDLIKAAGIEPYQALRLLAAIELGRRSGMAGLGVSQELGTPEKVFHAFEHLRHERKEFFCAAYLDAQNQMISKKVIHIGTVNRSLVGPREVFREAVKEGAASLIVVHNHPSGNPEPSPEDEAVTLNLADVGEMLDIPLLDHIIIGHHSFVSLKERGVL